MYHQGIDDLFALFVLSLFACNFTVPALHSTTVGVKLARLVLFSSSRGSEWRSTINADGCVVISEMTKTQLMFIPIQVQLGTQPLHPLTPTSGKL